MADKTKLEQMLEHLINEDTAKAEELFHEYVVEKSREIYENLIDAEIVEGEDAGEKDGEENKDPGATDKNTTEDFEDITIEADDDEKDIDPTGDLEGELDDKEGEEGEEGEEDEEEMSEKEPEELFQDLDSIVDEIQAKFDAMKAGKDMGDMGDMGGEKEAFEPELSTVREYVEKVADGHGAEKKGKAEASGANTKGMFDNMTNDMGGTTSNILRADVESEKASTKGGLLDPSTKDMNTGNINTVPGKANKAFSKKEPGHGAEKAGSKEDADNKQSLFRGRRS